MKKTLAFLMALLMLAAFAGCAQQSEPTPATPTPAPAATPEAETPPAAAPIADGAYEGTGHGFGGELKLTVTVEGGAIAAIEVTQHSETPGVSDMSLLGMPQRIIDAQSYAVDVISGATFTANAIKYAVKGALEAAGAPAGMFDAVPQAETKDEERSVDVVVVGAGLAGLSAAIEARQAGASVVVLEKNGRVGGNSIVAGGIVYATNSPLNKELDNDVDSMVDYYQMRANGKADEALLRYACENSGDTIAWMIEQGVEFKPEIGKGGTSPALRTHTSPTRGAGIVMPIYQKALDLGVEFLMETPATGLLSENGAISGVVAQNKAGMVTLHTKAVVMAAGGFDGDEAMRDQYAPHATGAGLYSNPANTGDYIAMGESVGAAMRFPDAVMGMRIVNQNAYLTDGVNILAWLNTIAVTDQGDRFENENDDYPINFTNMMNSGRKDFFWIYDSAAMGELCELAVQQGYGFKGETLEELAAAAGMDPARLTASVERYNSFAGGTDADFGKAGIVALAEAGPYYAIKVRPVSIAGFGGFVINTDSEVLDEAGSVIPGLYAAGECASGQFFDREYPASGTMLNIATVFGRTAGKNAAAFAK